MINSPVGLLPGPDRHPPFSTTQEVDDRPAAGKNRGVGASRADYRSLVKVGEIRIGAV